VDYALRVMRGEDVFGQVLLLAVALFNIFIAASGQTIYRKRTQQPVRHQGRARLALVAVGVALLFLWFAEYGVRYVY